MMSKESNYIKVGMSSCGIAAGAEEVYRALLDFVREKNISVEIKKTGCIGMCHAEPLIEVKIGKTSSVLYKQVNKDLAINILENALLNKKSPPDLEIEENPKQKKIVLRNCGRIDPENIEDYLKNKGYQAIKKTIFELGSEKTMEEIKKSGLRGRGGAGFPTWLKWNFTKEVKSQADKFIICNGDEGDPGAYMDRSVLEGDPHSVIEGMLIAGYTIGASKGYFYIRAEYPLAVERMQKAIDQCYDHGILGKKIFQSEFNFDVEIRLGAGAFVCGEETALIASIEGRRGYPRPRPPYPATQGLWNRPTVINNVETLANVPYIILNGADNYATIGTEKSKGTKVFALTGKVKKPGLAEIPMGMTLREIIDDIGGGILGDKKFKAVQTGGPSGGLIPEEYLDTPISYESLQNLGSIMGSGGMIVMNEDDCAVDVAKFFMKFCVDESCGKCAPCRIGTTQLLRILEKITGGSGELEDLDKLKRICFAMQKAALCGLGQTAPNPVLSSIRYFENEYIEHIKEKKCRSGKCTLLHKNVET
jgi:NADH:ubiquinone oxidoreductase subunit F (NADH-binding)